MKLQLPTESRTERLARLQQTWRYDHFGLTPDDVEWLLERAQEALAAGVGVCPQCARDLDAGQRGLCWACVRDAAFLDACDELHPLD